MDSNQCLDCIGDERRTLQVPAWPAEEIFVVFPFPYPYSLLSLAQI